MAEGMGIGPYPMQDRHTGHASIVTDAVMDGGANDDPALA